LGTMLMSGFLGMYLVFISIRMKY
ncbi:hypothetical protein JL09_g7066, partial [Pichia kudriavzevii]